MTTWHEIQQTSGAFKSSPRAKNDKRESKLQRAFCQWLGMSYPNVYFTSDASSLGAGFSTISNIQATKSRHAHLDAILLHPSKQYHFLVLEFKRESPYLRSGELSTEKHLQDQVKTMNLIRSVGGKCEFVWTLDMAMKITTEYLGESKIDNDPLF